MWGREKGKGRKGKGEGKGKEPEGKGRQLPEQYLSSHENDCGSIYFAFLFSRRERERERKKKRERESVSEKQDEAGSCVFCAKNVFFYLKTWMWDPLS